MLSPYVAQNLERVGKEVLDRHLAPRQEIRVGRAVVVGAIRIEERLKAGERLRTDDFFGSADEGRSLADEITEHALMSAMNAAEERKVDHIGSLLASIAMNPAIDVATGHQLIRIAEQISFRAFVLIDMLYRDDTRSYDPVTIEGTESAAAVHALRAELFDLSRLGLVEQRYYRDSADTLALVDAAHIDPSRLYLTPLGNLLCNAFDLASLSIDDDFCRRTKRQLAALVQLGPIGVSIDGGTF